MGILGRVGMGPIGIPDGKGDGGPVLQLEPQLVVISAADVDGRAQLLLVDAGLAQRRQQDKVLLPGHLHVHVLVVVAVHGRRRERVAHPHVDGVGLLVQRDAGKGDGSQGFGEQRRVLVT